MINIIIDEMKKYFDGDKKRINHAIKVLGFARDILKEEKADPEIVETTAVLHDIGIHEAEKKYGTSAGKFQEIEGPPIARNILQKIAYPDEKLEEVLEIIGFHHSPGHINTNNFKVLYDADWLVNLKDEYRNPDKEKLKRIIEKVFLTETGKKIARKLYL